MGIAYTRKTGMRKFYWWPKRLTLAHNPTIYRLGWWNFSFVGLAKKESK